MTEQVCAGMCQLPHPGIQVKVRRPFFPFKSSPSPLHSYYGTHISLPTQTSRINYPSMQTGPVIRGKINRFPPAPPYSEPVDKVNLSKVPSQSRNDPEFPSLRREPYP